MEQLQFHTNSPAETEGVGAMLAQRLQNEADLPPYIALYGDLGVGKTAFVRGFVGEISPNALVRSPTFALVNEYRGGARTVFHFDMYRVTDEEDLYSIGYDDYLTAGGICLVEWSENIPYALPRERLEVIIEKSDPHVPDARTIRIARKGEPKC